jgi:hypothetical protein
MEIPFNWIVNRYSFDRNIIFKIFIKYIHICLWLLEWGGGPIFLTGPGSISSLSGPAHNNSSRNNWSLKFRLM